MKTKKLKLLIWLCISFSLCSCTMPNGVSIGPTGDNGEEYITLNFSKVSLKFDMSKKLNTAFIGGDFGEFITYHNVVNPDWSNYSGAITKLSDFLWDEGRFDDGHKPSITITLEDNYGTTKHKCEKEDITWNTVLGIPNPNHLHKATIEVKSMKTSTYGIQVSWKKTATEDDWPINEFVSDGTITCDMPSITKGGTNNDNGDVAARGNTIISNTSDKTGKYYVLEEKEFISPDLRKPVLTKAAISDDLKWNEPTIYKAI